jgi:hypothetical protein
MELHKLSLYGIVSIHYDANGKIEKNWLVYRPKESSQELADTYPELLLHLENNADLKLVNKIEKASAATGG